VAYSATQGRQEILDELASATDRLGFALAALTEAYELLDESSGETLERELFRPVQLAYGRARHGHTAFAERQGLPTRVFEPPHPPAPSHGASGFITMAAEAVEEADRVLARLQDSMLPVEVGDAELRTVLEQVRKTVAETGPRSRQLQRRLGR
jgi:hypothetical protein